MRQVSTTFGAFIVLLQCLGAFAQDNSASGFATAAGNNARTNVYIAPYIFGDGSTITVKWKKDLDTTPYDTRRNAWGNIVFDDDGSMYWRGGQNAAQTQAGIIRTDPDTGDFVWLGALPDGTFTTAAPIVGTDYVYASRADDSNPTVYALNKLDGSLAWESDPLGPKHIGLTMALHDGVIYGVTQRADDGTNQAFAISATDGSVLYTAVISTDGDTVYGNTSFAPDVFGEGEHGLFWLHDNNGTAGLGRAIYGARMGPSSAGLMWSNTPIRAYPSNVVYSEQMDALYALHWGDYGSAAEAYDPVTGAKRWTAPGPGWQGGFNGGFYMTHSLKADGSGFLFGGFGHDVYSVSDPGDMGGAALEWSQVDWFYDGKPDELGEAQTMAVLIVDSQTQQQVYISGTSANGTISEKRRIYALDASTGTLLWSWFNPGDVDPYEPTFNFRQLSVGPNGDLYYFDAAEGEHGTLYALTAASAGDPPVITDMERGSMKITFTGGGQTYKVESSTSAYDYDETNMTWSDEATGLAPGTWEDTAPPTGSGAKKFYRVVGETDASVSDTVGMMVVDVFNGRNLISTPFEPYPEGGGTPGVSTLDKIIGEQLTGNAIVKTLSDNIELWDSAAQDWERAWLRTGTGWEDWYVMNGEPFAFEADTGYWFNRTLSHPDTTVVLFGKVATADRTIVINPKRNLVGSCYPVSVALDDSGLADSGFIGNALIKTLSDQVEFWDNSASNWNRFWLRTGSGFEGWDGQALKPIDPGDAIYVNLPLRVVGFTWTYPVPD